MATNPFNRGLNVASDLVPVTPNDNTDLAEYGRGIRCRPDGAAGTLRFRANDGTVRNTYIDAGETILVAVTRVHATGTTATNLEVLV
ncbi:MULTISPECIES: spike base protein, RCAP_Rcc01079 family [Rhizobium/Agrobacterium group]|uniref:spike base protein, RCAP_Rcc01079 family n=1 Tax=Rhizobium TaxID=379 RepID=UPI0028B01A1C